MSNTIKRTRRRRFATAFFGFVVFLCLGAIAAFIARAPVEGGAQSSPFTPQWDTAATYTSANDSVDMTCTHSGGAEAGTLALQITDAYPNGWCTFKYNVYLPESNAEEGKIIGADLTLPTGWTAEVVEGCGEVVPRRISGVEGIGVKVKITMTEQATTGQSTTFAANDGLAVTPLSSNAALQEGCV